MNAAIPNSSYKHQVSNAGFTLIELMVTIAVLAIIVSIATPSINNQIANQRVKSTTAAIENALKEAKAESIIRRQSITLSYDNNGTSAGSITTSGIGSNSYSAKSTVTSDKDTVTFSPNKMVNNEVTYTICDTSTSPSPRQVSVSKLANISSKLGGSCP